MKRMNSLTELETNRIFRLKTQIYAEEKLNVCFEHLKLGETDLILTGNSSAKAVHQVAGQSKARVLNTGVFGSGEPKEEWVDKILLEASAFSYERVIAIGGGAVLDIAKLCIFGDGRTSSQLFADKELLVKRRELIAIPTTCGTGSEVTSVSVVEFGALHSKLGLQMDDLFPDRAILIQELLEALPYKTFALTSIDALAHAIESLLSQKANAYTDMYARAAIEGIVENFKEVEEKHILPKDMRKSLICANMAGVAFSMAGCATMHALSFPLGANYHLAHGEAVYAVMESTLNYYREKNISLEKLEKILRPDSVSRLLELLGHIYECPDFTKMGIDEKICAEMAVSVFKNQQRLLKNSPEPLTEHDLENIYVGCIRGGK